MNVIKAWGAGWTRSLALPHIAFIKWITNSLVACALVVPIYVILSATLDHSLLANRIADAIPMDLYAELGVLFQDLSPVYMSLASAIAVLFLLLSLFISAGTLRAVTAENRPKTAEFFKDSAQFFISVTLVTLLSLLLAVIVLVPSIWLFEELSNRLNDWSKSPQTSFYFGWAALLVGFILFTFVARVSDYARLAVCSSDQKRSFSAFMVGLKTTWQQPFATLSLWLLCLATVAGLVFASSLLQPVIAPINNLWLTLALGQLVLILRIFARMAWLAAQHRLTAKKATPVSIGTAETIAMPAEADPAEYY